MIYRIHRLRRRGPRDPRRARAARTTTRTCCAAIAAIANDTGDVIVADVRNDGAIPDLPRDACVEVPARIDRRAATALPVEDVPVPVRGLLQAVKAYEQLTIDAAITRRPRTGHPGAGGQSARRVVLAGAAIPRTGPGRRSGVSPVIRGRQDGSGVTARRAPREPAPATTGRRSAVIKTEMPALLWIGGAPVPASTGETFPVLDPATEEVIGEAPRGVAEDIDRAVDAARAAARSREWRDMDPVPPRPDPVGVGTPDRRGARADREAALAREREAAQRGDRRGRDDRPLHRVLRGLGRQVRWARRRRAGRRPRVRAPRAAGRGRPGRALELPARRLRARRRAGPDGRATRSSPSPRPRRRCRRSTWPACRTRSACRRAS